MGSAQRRARGMGDAGLSLSVHGKAVAASFRTDYWQPDGPVQPGWAGGQTGPWNGQAAASALRWSRRPHTSAEAGQAANNQSESVAAREGQREGPPGGRPLPHPRVVERAGEQTPRGGEGAWRHAQARGRRGSGPPPGGTRGSGGAVRPPAAEDKKSMTQRGERGCSRRATPGRCAGGRPILFDVSAGRRDV
jgi:hypothetical protein